MAIALLALRDPFKWEIAKAIAALGPMPVEPLPPDELLEDIERDVLAIPDAIAQLD